MRFNLVLCVLMSVCLFKVASCSKDKAKDIKNSAKADNQITMEEKVAPGAPGSAPVWAFSGKVGIGTSYEMYPGDEPVATEAVSKVWFSIANGVLTETMYGLIHEAQIKHAQLILVGKDFVDIESEATTSTIDYLYKNTAGAPLSLAYKIINEDKEKKYTIEKHFFTHPNLNSVVQRTILKTKEPNIQAYFYVNPHIANTGVNDKAWTDGQTLFAAEENTVLAVQSSQAWQRVSVGFVGESDGLSALAKNKELQATYTTTGEATGNVAMIAQLPDATKQGDDFVMQTDIVLAFGRDVKTSQDTAQQTLAQGYQRVLDGYNGKGESVGWEDYLSSLENLPKLTKHSNDDGKLLHASALVLKAQEDKTHHGALIASLSTPWGDTVSATESATGYKAVWPRDFYQCAMALLALGDTKTPKVAFEYLTKVQVKKDTPLNKGDGGWFLQKSHVDGTPEWVGVQLDQTAMPIMLGWKLWQHGVLTDEEAIKWYHSMLKPAAQFLVTGGKIDIDWNQTKVTPPHTQQERWEEQSGYSPSTIASVIVGLLAAADLAWEADDNAQAGAFTNAADKYRQQLVSQTFTTQGNLNKAPSNGHYFLRVTDNADPNDKGTLVDRNGQGEINESDIIDAGFLELVRYGVFFPDKKEVVDTLEEIDNTQLPDDVRVRYDFKAANGQVFPGWRRYGKDGYGEDAKTGANYGENNWDMTPGQRGRVWPFLTGERGHYALKMALWDDGELGHGEYYRIKGTYVAAMEYFANDGLMLPEQVWDGVGHSTRHNYQPGDGTNSATPLAWAHAEYVKLLKSLEDERVWDEYNTAIQRYDH